MTSLSLAFILLTGVLVPGVSQVTGSSGSRSANSGILGGLQGVPSSGTSYQVPQFRSFVTPARTAAMGPSAIEAMYGRHGEALGQFGYSTLIIPLVENKQRGRIPEPYTLALGDVLTLLLWGDPVDFGELSSQYSMKVGGDGNVFYPVVGLLRAEGVERAELEKTISTGLGRKYKRFELRLKVDPVHDFPITVSGMVGQPGSVLVDTWTTISEVVAQAGGVEKNGTLRNLRLTKADGTTLSIDLYDQLMSGKPQSVKFDEGDSLWVGPIGKTAAISGTVKRPGIYELKATETLADLVRFAGGTLASSRGTPVVTISWSGSHWTRSSNYLNPDDHSTIALGDGDVYQFGYPIETRNSPVAPGFVNVSGEVNNPKYLVWRPGMTLQEALTQCGGVTDHAYLPGIALIRSSVGSIQRKQVQKAIDDNNRFVGALQTALAKTTDVLESGYLLKEIAARQEANSLLSDVITNGNLGRVSLRGETHQTVLVEPGDTISVPPVSSVMMVVGAVYSPGVMVWKPNMTVRQLLDMAGGATPMGNSDEAYMIRASGMIENTASSPGLFGSALWTKPVEPGDILYIPLRKTEGVSGWSVTKEIIQIVTNLTSTSANTFAVLKTLGLL